MKCNRKVYIDYLRAISCLAVIMIHIFSTARTDFINHTNFEEIISEVIINLFHFAVPIFFMITGNLFLSKNKEYELKEFFKKYILKYILAILSFGYIYAIIEEVFNKNYSISMPITALLNTIQGKTWDHMWYLYSLIGVMLLIPILKVLLSKGEYYLKYLLVILIISSILVPFVGNIFGFKVGVDFIIASPYLAYSIIGYFLGNSKKEHNLLFSFLLVVSTVFIVLSQIMPFLTNNIFLTDKLTTIGNYNSPFILCLSISIFKLFININKENKIINLLSKESYGIYLVHMFWINFIYKYLKINIYGQFLLIKPLLVFMFVLILSYLTTLIIKRLPFINRLI